MEDLRPECERVFNALNASNDRQTEQLVRIEKALIRHLARQEEHDKRVGDLESAVYGNGKEGLKTAMAKLSTKMAIVIGIGSAIGLALVGFAIDHIIQ